MDISVEAKEMLLQGINAPNSAFTVDGDGHTVLRHDSIRFTLDGTQALVELIWQGRPVMHERVALLASGDSVTLSGISGSNRVTLT